MLYASESFEEEPNNLVDQVACTEQNKALNPLGVVLESFVNIMTEKYSSDKLTQSENVTFIDPSLRQLAIDQLIKISEKNPTFLTELHDRWLKQVSDFLSAQYKKGVRSLHELVFQVSLQFRISSVSSALAIKTIIKPKL